MAKKANVVIGANFGDEGKGLVTDFLSAQNGPETLVVRHNGGAQAGHTVVTPEGKRHVFHHFGSGTLAGAKTFLSRFYACNPILFFKELPLLNAMDIEPVVYVAPDAPITTPYDMMINQIAEETRGHDRHGSCGVGFGETIERHLSSSHIVCFRDLENIDNLREKLKDIQKSWSLNRLASLNMGSVSEVWNDRLQSEEILERYIQEAENFRDMAMLAPDDLLTRCEHIVFEGAQGLLLDQEKGWFPHVTRSYTGIKNASILAAEAGIEELNVVYATRAYATRHGAGPLPHELPEKPYAGIKDDTNFSNLYQGELRFAWLDLDLLSSSIKTDLKNSSLRVQHQLAVTCVDQVGDQITFVERGRRCQTNINDFLQRTVSATQSSSLLISCGPTRSHVSLALDFTSDNG